MTEKKKSVPGVALQGVVSSESQPSPRCLCDDTEKNTVLPHGFFYRKSHFSGFFTTS